MKKTLTGAALFVCLLTAALSAEILEQVLVKVNGEIVTQTEFHRIQLAALRELPEPAGPEPLVGRRAVEDARANHPAGHRYRDR